MNSARNPSYESAQTPVNGAGNVEPGQLFDSSPYTLGQPDGTTADGVHAVLLAVEEPSDSDNGEGVRLDHVVSQSDGALTIPVMDVVRYLLHADRELDDEARSLEDGHDGVPGIAENSDTKLQWGIRIGEVAGDRRRIRQSVLKLAERLPEEVRNQVLESMEQSDV